MDSDPDFARLYADPDGLSPRMACYLWDCAGYLSDLWHDSLAEPDELEILAAGLPPIARRLADQEWYRRFAQCFEDLRKRFGEGDVSYLGMARSTGEEMALHMVIDLAEDRVHDADLGPARVAHLPVDPERDTDWEGARFTLFADHDVLLLFQGSADGIEDPTSELNQLAGIVNLHPSQWFVPFDAESDDDD